MLRPLVTVGTAAAVAGLAVGSLLTPYAGASSHREAPSISRDPTADNTDLYAFVSQDKPSSVTFVANYIPFEEPAGGPNFNAFDDTVLYEIHVDNNGDAKDDITYQFRFQSTLTSAATFLYAVGPISTLTDPDWIQRQAYTLTRVDKTGSHQLGGTLQSPPVNVGPRTDPNYAALVSSAVQNVAGGVTVFAGQRDDPFFVDLGSIFDLGALRPFQSLHIIPSPGSTNGIDAVGGYNVHSIVLQVPIAQLTSTGHAPTGPTDPHAVIGIYASASRQATRVLHPNGTATNSGPWVQVSRLGNPLVNEVIIPTSKKDFWNASDPSGDSQFASLYTSPELAADIDALYPVFTGASHIDTTGRTDLVTVLLTGIPGVNFTGNKQADLLRLNMAIPPSAPVGQGNRLGALDPTTPDVAGFPNGRRPEDDVIDIEIRAVAQGYGAALNSSLGLPDKSPNDTLGDGVDANDRPFTTSFPYLATPWQGYADSHGTP